MICKDRKVSQHVQHEGFASNLVKRAHCAYGTERQLTHELQKAHRAYILKFSYAVAVKYVMNTIYAKQVAIISSESIRPTKVKLTN